MRLPAAILVLVGFFCEVARSNFSHQNGGTEHYQHSATVNDPPVTPFAPVWVIVKVPHLSAV